MAQPSGAHLGYVSVVFVKRLLNQVGRHYQRAMQLGSFKAIRFDIILTSCVHLGSGNDAESKGLLETDGLLSDCCLH